MNGSTQRSVVMFVRAFIVIFGLLLAGCATVSNTLSLTEVKSLRIESIEVNYLTEDAIWWGAAEREYAEKAKAQPAAASGPARKSSKVEVEDSVDAHARLVNSPEGKAYVKNKLSALITERIKRALGTELNGNRPVKLTVNVVSFVIPSAAQRVVLGGTPILGAVTILKDARTGAELGKMNRNAAAYAGNGVVGVLVDQGFSDLEDRLLDAYAAQVRDWLLAEPQSQSPSKS